MEHEPIECAACEGRGEFVWGAGKAATICTSCHGEGVVCAVCVCPACLLPMPAVECAEIRSAIEAEILASLDADDARRTDDEAAAMYARAHAPGVW